MTLSHDPIPPERIRPLRRKEYERLAELGVFKDEKVELLYGRIVRMSSDRPHRRSAAGGVGGPHRYGVDHLAELLIPALRGRARVSIQSSFAATDDSEPEPDVVVAPLGDYLDEPPRTAFLIVEVAETSLADDRRKARIYAAAGVPEYWIVNLVDGFIEVYREPRGDEYAIVTRHTRSEVLCVPSFEDVAVPVSDVLPPLK